MIFLGGGTFNGVNQRSVTIRSGTAVFLTLETIGFSDLFVDPETRDGGLPLTPDDELANLASGIVDSATAVSLEIDGKAVKNILNYRFAPPVFDSHWGEGNTLAQFLVSVGLPYFPAQEIRVGADGYFVMISPLPPGEHEIHYHIELPAFGSVVDITYAVTVVPAKQ